MCVTGANRTAAVRFAQACIRGFCFFYCPLTIKELLFSALVLLAITLEKRVYWLTADFSQRGGRDDVWRMT